MYLLLKDTTAVVSKISIFIQEKIGLSQTETVNEQYSDIISYGLLVLLLAVIAIIADWLGKKILLSVLKRISERTKTNWDDTLYEKKVFDRLSHIIPAFIVFLLIPVALQGLDLWIQIVQAAAKIYMVIIMVRVVNSFLNALQEIYSTFEISKYKPIKGYVQVVQIIIYFIAGILILSYLMGKSPIYFLTGLGALTAVLLLVFKDLILGFVASIQLSANDMVRPGDWITMTKFGADGDVLSISLTSIKIRNFDQTIVYVPTYSLIANGFQNWRGMSESQGRRIKRSIYIDLETIRFADKKMLEKLKKVDLIKPLIEAREDDIAKYYKEKSSDAQSPHLERHQTNIGIFRAYIETYLKNHPLINTEMTMLIRQLPPKNQGLPIEVYVFSKIQAWVEFEAVQSDVFDHLIAIVPEFDLKVFQDPTGDDIRSINTKKA